MTQNDIARLLDRITVLRHPCDLDLLVFFARHRRSLLTSEQLAVWLGYEIKRIAESLELLLNAGFVTRTQNPTHAARMYVFAAGGSSGGWLPSLVALASTREGRLSILAELARRGAVDTGNSETPSAYGMTPASGPRPTLVRQTRQSPSDTKVR